MTGQRSVSRTIRNKFIAGLIIVIPIVLTVKALWWLFTYVDSLAAPLAEQMLGRPIPGIGFIITLAVVMLAGILFSSGPLQRLLHGLEELVDSIPVGEERPVVRWRVSLFNGGTAPRTPVAYVLCVGP